MHKSVLLEECLTYLNLKEDSIVVDCTLGYGGHSSEILKRIPKGFLYAFDQDQDAIDSSRERLSKIGSNFEIINSNFRYLKEELNKRKVEQVDAILFDLGVSSPQLDEKERGFSFHQDAVLDMRMDQTQALSARVVVNQYSYHDLVRIFKMYGEEQYATSIARKIESEREKKPIETTLELVSIIQESVPEKYRREKHPARKVFQAIRIEVNHELEVCEIAVRDSLELLKLNGRVCVITFHSLEDRIVKNILKEKSEIKNELKGLPIIPEQYLPSYKILGAIDPSKEEIEENKRARSAKLRVVTRIKEA